MTLVPVSKVKIVYSLTLTTMTKRIQTLGILFSAILLFSFVSVEKSSDEPASMASFEGYRFDNQCQKGNGLNVEYFADDHLGRRVFSGIEPNIDFFLYRASPKHNVPAHRFSARWTGGIFTPESGTYTFYMNVDDGARIWIDDQLVLDKWDLHEPTEFSFKAQMMGGSMHKIKVEYVQYMFNEAVAQLSWSYQGSAKHIIPTMNLYPCPDATCFEQEQTTYDFGNQCKKSDPYELGGKDTERCRAGDGLKVEYFADTRLRKLVVTDVEPTINFAHYRTRPRKRVPADEFSARWTGGLYAPEQGLYQFYFTVDDGVRVWIDDQLVLDKWDLNKPTEFQFEAYMTGGKMHSIRVEYVQFMFNEAVARLEWKTPSQPRSLVPMSNLYSDNNADCSTSEPETQPVATSTAIEEGKKKKFIKRGVIAAVIISILTALRFRKPGGE